MAGQWFDMITSEIIEKGTEKYNYINKGQCGVELFRHVNGNIQKR
jgi:hypothetical protein